MNEEDGEDGVEHEDEEDDRNGEARLMKQEHDVNDAQEEEEEEEDTTHAISIVNVDENEGDEKFRLLVMGHREPYEWKTGPQDAPVIGDATFRQMQRGRCRGTRSEAAGDIDWQEVQAS